MGVTGEAPDEPHTFREQWTTIVLRERDDGTWLATQSGVGVEGTGDTAAAAATDYCRKVEDGDE
jgi:hypothetical protein